MHLRLMTLCCAIHPTDWSCKIRGLGHKNPGWLTGGQTKAETVWARDSVFLGLNNWWAGPGALDICCGARISAEADSNSRTVDCAGSLWGAGALRHENLAGLRSEPEDGSDDGSDDGLHVDLRVAFAADGDAASRM